MISRCSDLIDQPPSTNRSAGSRAVPGASAARPRAEVVRGPDEPPAEVVLPDAVDHHAGGQRVRGSVSQPASCSRPLPASSGGSRLAAEDLEEPARDLGAQLLGLALELDPGVGRRAFRGGVGLVEGRQLLHQLVALLLELLHPGLEAVLLLAGVERLHRGVGAEDLADPAPPSVARYGRSSLSSRSAGTSGTRSCGWR